MPPRNVLYHGRRLVALDVGQRRVGVAVSDELGMIASPVTTIDLRSQGLSALREAIERYDPERIIIGLPKNMSGTEGSQAQAVRRFADELAETLKRPIEFWDERLTSFSAEQSLNELGHRGKKRKGKIDAIAASFILQSYLNSRDR